MRVTALCWFGTLRRGFRCRLHAARQEDDFGKIAAVAALRLAVEKQARLPYGIERIAGVGRAERFRSERSNGRLAPRQDRFCRAEDPVREAAEGEFPRRDAESTARFTAAFFRGR